LLKIKGGRNMHQISNQYAALVLIEILYEKGLINKATYENIMKSQKPQTAEIREEKSA
jgi:hypothetical protein